MKPPYAAIAAALAASFVAFGHAHADPPPDCAVRYGIYRNGDRIGTHRVRFASSESRVVLEHDVEIRVQVLGMTVYRYDLSARETWDDGRLIGLRSTTDKNGTALSVVAHTIGERIQVRRADGRRVAAPAGTIPADPHWLVPMEGSMHMIEAEDGQVREVRVSGPRNVILETRGQRTRARRYDVSGEHTASLWYDERGILIRKRIVASDGSRIVTMIER